MFAIPFGIALSDVVKQKGKNQKVGSVRDDVAVYPFLRLNKSVARNAGIYKFETFFGVTIFKFSN